MLDRIGVREENYYVLPMMELNSSKKRGPLLGGTKIDEDYVIYTSSLRSSRSSFLRHAVRRFDSFGFGLGFRLGDVAERSHFSLFRGLGLHGAQFGDIVHVRGAYAVRRGALSKRIVTTRFSLSNIRD